MDYEFAQPMMATGISTRQFSFGRRPVMTNEIPLPFIALPFLSGSQAKE
jgi:hypothetical protein